MTNDGNVGLSDVTVTDDQTGVTPAYVSGDADSDGVLDLSETWIYTASGTATAGPYANTGEACGSFTADVGGTREDCETDSSSYFGADPQIEIDKTTNGADGQTILVGQAITWTYTVTNDGNVGLSDVTVTDDQTGVTPAYVSGDADSDGVLDLSETWIYTASGTATAGPYANTGEACGSFTADVGGTREDCEDDSSSYFGADPQIEIDKTTNGADGQTILVGQAITWTYTVTNDGNVGLSDVTVTDDQTGVTPAYVSGDADSDGVLDLSETWIYTASGTATAGPYANTGEACGSFTADVGGTREDCETDSSSYFGADPQIEIDKTTNGADGQTILVGQAITWTYTVTNDGNVGLSDVTVTDDQTGVTPAYVSGDADSDGVLDLSETWIYTASGTATAGPYANTGEACGSFTADVGGTREDCETDSSSYFGADPQIEIDKTTNGADGQTILVGQAITWTYTVTNDGNVGLSDVTVTDDQTGVTPAYVSGDADSDGVLDLSETWIYTASGTATAGPYANTGEACGSFTADVGGTREDCETDTSSYFGADPQIEIDKTTNGADGQTILVGQAITWTYTVTNDGNVGLSDVTVTDDQTGVTPAYVSGDADSDGVLDLSETWIYTASGTATAGPYANTGEACGSFTADVGGTREDCETDTSSYFGADPSLTIEKQVSVDGGAAGTFVDADTTTGPTLVEGGDDPVFRFLIHNTGNVALDVTLTDSVFILPPTCDPGVLAANDNAAGGADEFSCTVTGTWAAGQHSNEGIASATYTDDAANTETVTEKDKAHYFGADPSISLSKSAAPTTYNTVGQVITYTYTITNTGNVTLTGPFSVTDNKTGTISPCGSGPLAPAGTTSCTATYSVTQADINAGSITNTATATATYTDDAGNDETVTSNTASATVRVVVGSTSQMTNSAFQLVDDLTPWQTTDFEILVNGQNIVVATNPGQIYYHQRATSPYSIPTNWDFTLNWPCQFESQTAGGQPLHAYIQYATDSPDTWRPWTQVSNVSVANVPFPSGCAQPAGTPYGEGKITVNNVPAGARVWVTAHLDYAPKGDNINTVIPNPMTKPVTYGPFSSRISMRNGPTDGVGTSTSTTTVIGRGKKVTMVYGVAKDPIGEPPRGYMGEGEPGHRHEHQVDHGTDRSRWVLRLL